MTLVNCDFELKNGSEYYLQGFMRSFAAHLRTYDLALKVSGHTAFFFLCILVAKVETVILS